MVLLTVAHKNFIDTLRSEGKSEATVIAYSKDIEQLLDHLGNKGIEEVAKIEIAHLEEFMKKLADASYTPKSISRKTNATRTFIKYLHKEGQIDVNIGDQLRHPKLETKKPRILSKLEYRALRDAAKDDIRSYAMIEVLLQTGVTISELADIKLADLDIKGDKGTLSIGKKNSKEARSIPLNHAVIESVKKYIETERPTIEKAKNLFVTKTGNALLVRNIRSTINRYFRLAGVENAKVNDLRHTFVAHHLSMGVSILHLAKISGHKRISTIERYLQYIEKTDGSEKTELGIL
jgi:site-specific recombinase XerD